jgi:hypothetical protein
MSFLFGGKPKAQAPAPPVAKPVTPTSPQGPNPVGGSPGVGGYNSLPVYGGNSARGTFLGGGQGN